MFGTFHYVPALKWKQGEYIALKAVPDVIKQFMTPIVNFVDADDKEWDKHIEASVSRVVQAWGTNRPVFLDPYHVGEIALDDHGVIATRAFFEEAAKKGLKYIPVVSPYYSDKEINATIGHTEHGLCIRLRGDEADEAGLERDINDLMKRLDVPSHMVDIVFDLEYIQMTEKQAYRISVSTLNMLSHLGNWRTLTICGTSFPPSMQGFPTGAISEVQRKEGNIWNRIIAESKLVRLPSFGDYTIQHPAVVEYDPIMHPSATIRYALEDRWLLVRGYGVRARGRGGYGQFKGLSNQLRMLDNFYGKAHCNGCRQIDEIADRDDGFGNLSTWVQIGTCHHLTVTTEAIQGLSDASNSSAPAL